jgi:transcriptional regulator with XRE-family HTH domain
MPKRLTADGATIRALRLKRGWTQEQLAEIAGVSCRTIQRTEAVDTAAFETLRAIAGAFDTHFDLLLKAQQGSQLPDPKAEFREPTQPAEVIPDLPAHSRPSSAPDGPRGRWKTPLLAAASVLAGLMAGVLLMHRPEIPAGVQPSARLRTTSDPARNAVPHQLPEYRIAAITGLDPARNPELPDSTPGKIQAKDGPDTPVGDRAEVLTPAESALQPAVYAVERIPLDVQLRPWDLNAMIAMPQDPVAGATVAASRDSSEQEAGSGAVRQAVGHATRRTGDFFALVGDSMRRVF